MPHRLTSASPHAPLASYGTPLVRLLPLVTPPLVRLLPLMAPPLVRLLPLSPLMAPHTCASCLSWQVWLCEINASPAVADELLPGLVDALIRTAIDPICPPNAELLKDGEAAYLAAAAKQGSGERFECICHGRPAPE